MSDLHYLKSGSRDIAQLGLPREVVRRLSGLEPDQAESLVDDSIEG